MNAAVVAPAYVPRPAEGRYRRVLAAVGAAARRGLRFRLRCLLLGHEDSFARHPRRLMLRCATCGRETPGWAIGPGAPTAPVATPYSRLAVVAPGPRVRPWGLGLWRARAEARDRQRLRMVQAAARASEPRVEGTGRAEPPRERNQPRRLAGEPQPDGWMDVARRVRAGLGG